MIIEPRAGFWPALIVLLCVRPFGAAAQEASGATSASAPRDLASSNFVDVGARGTVFGSNSDRARFERYRDLRNGPTLDALRFSKDTNTHAFNVQADHAGYRNQRYSASYNQYGKLKVTFEWNQIPLFFSRDTASLFNEASPGVLRVDDAIQSGIENRTTTLASVVGGAQSFALSQRRDVLSLNLAYSATKAVDWTLSMKTTAREGSQAWAGTFGFGNAVELAVPVDTRTTDVGTALEWANERGMARVGYDSSFFRNGVGTLVWDNPLRLTDSPTAGPSQGRMALWPNSNMNAGSANAMLNLPGHSRATAYLSVGAWSQDDPLIPFTSNSAIQAPSLDRPTADARARVTSTNYAFTSKPTRLLWLSTRYRSYEYDNHTPLFHVANTVAYDTTPVAFAEGETSPYSFTRRSFDADASLSPNRHFAFRAGYTREHIDQTFRFVDATTEDTVRVSADVTGADWLTVRALYQHGERVGSGLDEQVLDDLGEQVSLRQFDIADRTLDRFSGIVQVSTLSALSFNGTVSVGQETRPGAVFGLRSNKNHTYSAGVDYVPTDDVSFGLSYQYEKYDARQVSRQANPGPQFNDLTRDWSTDGADTARTVSASLDLLKLWRSVDFRLAYDYSRAESLYVYGLAPNTTLAPVTQLPAVRNKLQRGTADLRYQLTRHVALGGAYWYDAYAVNDFASVPETLSTLAQPSLLILRALYRPYTANTIMGRLTYFW